jgi:hypothetical protein
MSTLSVTPYDPLFASAGVANNVDPNLAAAVASVESGYSPGAVGTSGEQGLMQLLPSTGAGLGVTNPTDPTQNINGGTKYLSQMLTKFGNVPDALRGYNAGPNNQANWNNPTTNAYVGKVQAAYQDIKRAGGIQYAQADTGTATDAGPAPIPGRPSDAQMLQMTTGSGAPSPVTPSATATPGTSTAASSSTVAPIAGRPSDAAMLQMTTAQAPVTSGTSPSSAASGQAQPQAQPQGQPAAAGASPSAPATAGGVAQFQQVPAHLAPDGSGIMTNLSDPDYYRFTGKAPPQAAVAAAVPQAAGGAAPGAPQGTSAAGPAAALGAPQGTSATGSTAPSSPGSVTLPPWVVAAGTGALDSMRGVARTVANGAGWVDNQVPALAALDNSVGENPQGVSSELLSDINANRQKYASSPAYTAGSIGGDLAASLPLMEFGGAGVGAVGDALGTAFPGVTNALLDAANGVRSSGKLGSLLLKGGGNALTGAAQGAGVAAATSGGSDQPFLQQVKQGAELGGVAGAVVPAAIGTARGIGGVIAGGSTDAETAALAQEAQNRGIPITLGQLSDSGVVHVADSVSKRVPFSGSASQTAAQQTAFNRAIGGTIGQTADKITPQVMSAAKAQIGATMSQIENSNAVSLDAPFLNDVAAIEKNAQSSLTDPEFKVVSRQLDNVMANLQPGDTITGQTYGNLIHKGSPLDAALNSRDSNIANYSGQIKGALQDALTRSLSPADQATYTQARYQYKNLKTIEDLAEKSTTGDISPTGLMQAVRSSYGDMAYTGGGGDLGTLARIGQRFMKEPPDSGTAARLAGYGAIAGAGGLMAHVLTGATTPVDAGIAAAGALGTLGLARGARAYLGSQTLANRLIKRGLNPGTGNGLVNRLTGGTTALAPAAASVTGNRLLQPGQR